MKDFYNCDTISDLVTIYKETPQEYFERYLNYYCYSKKEKFWNTTKKVVKAAGKDKYQYKKKINELLKAKENETAVLRPAES